MSDDPSITPGRSLAIVCVGVCLVLFVTVGAVVPLLNLAFGLWFVEVFVFFGVGWELTRLSGRNPVAYAGLDRPSGFGIAAGALLGLVNFAGVVAPLQLLSRRLLEPYVPAWLKQDVTALFLSASPLELAIVVGAVGLAAPIAEELVFRGVIQQGLAESGHSRRALFVTALIFSAFHLDAVGFAARVELGILFGLLFYATRSVWPGIAAHAANNLTSTVLFLLGRDADGVDAPFPSWKVTLVLGVSGTVLIGALWRILSPWLRASAPTPTSLPHPPRSLFPALRRWGGAALLAIAALVLVDRRGVELNGIDLLYPLPSTSGLRSMVPPPELQKLRARARRGEVPVAVYRARRQELFEAKRHRP